MAEGCRRGVRSPLALGAVHTGTAATSGSRINGPVGTTSSDSAASIAPRSSSSTQQVYPGPYITGRTAQSYSYG